MLFVCLLFWHPLFSYFKYCISVCWSTSNQGKHEVTSQVFRRWSLEICWLMDWYRLSRFWEPLTPSPRKDFPLASCFPQDTDRFGIALRVPKMVNNWRPFLCVTDCLSRVDSRLIWRVRFLIKHPRQDLIHFSLNLNDLWFILKSEQISIFWKLYNLILVHKNWMQSLLSYSFAPLS